MSRFYRVEIEVKPVANDKEKAKILHAFADYGLEKENACRSDGVLTIDGNITLSGGKSPEEKHAEWKKDKAMKGKLLTTRWLCWDLIDWHDVIVDDDW